MAILPQEVPAGLKDISRVLPGKVMRALFKIASHTCHYISLLNHLFLVLIMHFLCLRTSVCCLSCMKNWTRASSSLILCTRHIARLSLRAASSDRRLYWAISSFLQFSQSIVTHTVQVKKISWGLIYQVHKNRTYGQTVGQIDKNIKKYIKNMSIFTNFQGLDFHI